MSIHSDMGEFMGGLPRVNPENPLHGQVFELLETRRFEDSLLTEANRARALAAMLSRSAMERLTPELHLSNTSFDVLKAACDVAGSPEISPLHLLAGFLRVGARVEGSTASYLRHLAGSHPWLEQWMGFGPPPERSISVDLMNPTLTPFLREARVYSRFTGALPRAIHARHLAAALFAPSLTGNSALEMALAAPLGSLERASDVLHDLREGLQLHLEGGAPRHEPRRTWWLIFNLPYIVAKLEPDEPVLQQELADTELPQPEEPEPTPSIGSDFLLEPVAGIRSDVVDGVDLADRLNIEPDVSALCSIIAARSVEPPLAIGLFGDWGTGKSFFMSKMEMRLRMICAQEPPGQDASGNPYYFRDIAQIRFNAWHYSDGNLWASLMARLFEGLSRYGIENGSSDVEERLRAQLRSAELVLGDAQGRIAAAQARRQQAEQHSRDVQQRQRQVETLFIRHLGSGVLERVKKQLSEQIARRWPEFGPKELLKWHEQLHQGGGRLSEIWAWVQQGGRTRAALLILGALVTTLSPFVIAELADTELWGKVLGLVFGPLATLASWGPVVLPKVNKVIATLDAARAELDKIDEKLVKEVQTTLGELEQEEARAQEVALKASTEVDRLKAELAKAHPTQRLRDFLADRDQSSDYRQHLGLISLIRNDLAALSDLLGNARDTQSVGLPAVDRIVLYIDDLDRCPEDRIVQVLEAVHLLLAFPLFVVVVGVDSRWLLHALKKRYAAFSDEDAATPQAYLEKIFQIPFTLHRMEETGFASLIDFLLPTASPPEKTAEPSPQSARGQGVLPQSSGTPAAASSPVRPTGQGGQLPVGRASPSATMAPSTPAAPKLRPRLLQLSVDEVKVIKGMWRLIPTPRATNRLANSYRLLRVRLSESREAAFLGRGCPAEYPLVVVLLATMIGFPEEFSLVLRLAKNPELKEKTWGELKAMFTRARGLEQLAHSLGQLELEQDLDALPIESIRYWLGVVCRFSFHLRDELPDASRQDKSASRVLAESTVEAARQSGVPAPEGGAPAQSGPSEDGPVSLRGN